MVTVIIKNFVVSIHGYSHLHVLKSLYLHLNGPGKHVSFIMKVSFKGNIFAVSGKREIGKPY